MWIQTARGELVNLATAQRIYKVNNGPDFQNFMPHEAGPGWHVAVTLSTQGEYTDTAYLTADGQSEAFCNDLMADIFTAMQDGQQWFRVGMEKRGD